MYGSCSHSLFARRIPPLVATLALAAVVLAVAPGRCLGQDLRPYVSLYDAQEKKGHFPDAERTARAALEIARRAGDENAMRFWLIRLGDALRQQRKLREAEPILRQAL